MLTGQVILKEQELEGDYQFAGIPQYMTAAFLQTFQEEAVAIAFTAIALILEEYPNNADYLQTFQYVCSDKRTVPFWIINDVDHLTVLLPSDY